MPGSRVPGSRVRPALAALAAALVATVVGCAGDPHDPTGGPSWQVESSPQATEATPVAPVRPLAHGLGTAPDEPAPEEPAPATTPEPHSTPTRSAPAEPEPEPPPIPPRYEGECIAEYVGEAVDHDEVAAALSGAAARTYWPSSAPEISVPENLLRATAWQESGWQTNIIACDGGVGLMQVMPDTADWMNQRFGQSYDIDVYTDNAYLGGTYYAWLIKFFGDLYFEGDYTVDPADCDSHVDPCLLNAVIASYNFGHGAVDTDDGIVIPNPRYVENVRALMTSCECLSY
jgi:soluble lytic murein transglycosylase-like protein